MLARKLAGALVAYLAVHPAASEVLNFDDITAGDYIENWDNDVYGGLSWTGWVLIDPARYYNRLYQYPLNAPYAHGPGVASGTFVIVSRSQITTTISSTRYFKVNSGFFSGSVNPTVNIQVTGLARGQSAFSQTYTYSKSVGAPTNLNTPWITEIIFDPDDWFSIDDLSVTFAPDVAATRTALLQNGAALRGVMDRRLSGLAMMSNYDCSTFDRLGYCVSFQARSTGSDGMSEGAGVLTSAYKLTDQVRVGGFIDYRASEREPTGVSFSNDLPTFGAFVGYSQNRDGTGIQGKVLAAFQNGDATVTRAGVTALGTESGSGKASLNSYVFSGELGYGVMLSSNVLATPYAGIRYTDSTRGAYDEAMVTGSVEYPISYNSYHRRLTTAVTGVRLAGMLTDRLGYQIGAGIEQDLNRKTSRYSGTSTIPDLENFSLVTTGANNRTRGVGTVGMFYQVEKNQRLIGNVSIRNQAYTSQTAVSAMGGYQVAF